MRGEKEKPQVSGVPKIGSLPHARGEVFTCNGDGTILAVDFTMFKIQKGGAIAYDRKFLQQWILHSVLLFFRCS